MPAVDFNNVSGKTVSPSKLAHVVFRTKNKDTLTKFYVEFLGGYVVHENPTLSFVTYDDEHHRIAIGQIPELGTKDWNRAGLEHIAFTFDTLEDLFLSYRQRKAKGIEPFWCINHGLTISLYYYDPDGNVLETQVDTFTENGAATRFMESEVFAKNPIGAEIDPEEFIKRIENGETFESLIVQPDVGPRGMDSVPTLTKEQIALAAH